MFLALVLGYLVVFRLLQRSHIGWAFRALRDDEVAAELAGVDVTRYRVFAGLLGSAMIGLAGALYAHSEGFIAPSTYAFGNVDVRVLVMVAFGGIGTLLGPVVGAAAFTSLDEWLVSFNQYRLSSTARRSSCCSSSSGGGSCRRRCRSSSASAGASAEACAAASCERVSASERAASRGLRGRGTQ